MTAFETPWFLKSKTTDVGRANQIVEEKLQRSVTELEFKARKSMMKLDRRIDIIIDEYKTLKEDVDFSTDLDKNGKPLDPEEVRTKSCTDTRSKRKLQNALTNPNKETTQSAHTGYKIRPRKVKHKFSTQELMDKLTEIREREECRDWNSSPHYMYSLPRFHKLKPIEGVTNKLPVRHETNGNKIIDTNKEQNCVDETTKNEAIDNDSVEKKGNGDEDMKLIREVKDANIETGQKKNKTKKKRKRRAKRKHEDGCRRE